MRSTNVAEAKAHLAMLIEKALAGEEVVISEHGKPIVRLVPYEPDTSSSDMDVRICEDEVKLAKDFGELPAEMLEAFTGKFDEPLA